MSESLSLSARIRGSALGVAVGDALGWPQEQNSKNLEQANAPELRFRSWRRRAGGRFQPFGEQVGAGEYSDDTQLTLCVARSLLRDADWYETFTRSELPTWASYERGGGRSVLRAASSWALGRPPWRSDKGSPRDYFATGANGVAMRALPHVVAGLSDSFEPVRRRVVLDGCSTHGHATALVGALIHTSSLWFALHVESTLAYGELLERVAEQDDMWSDLSDLRFPDGWLEARRQMRGPSFEEEWGHSVDQARHLLDVARNAMQSGPLADDEETLQELGVLDRKVNGSGIVTAVAALLIASRSASSPELGLLQAAFLPSADTDTLASMTASILGAISGTEWMNGMHRDVQDSDYIVHIADSLRSPLQSEVTSSASYTVTKSRLDRWTKSLAELREGAPTNLPNGRLAFLERAEEMPSESLRQKTVRYRLRAHDGETLFVVKHSKTSKPAAAGRTQISPVGVRVRVTGLSDARTFYEKVLGLNASRSGETFVRYGDAFALEAAPVALETLRLAKSLFVIQIEASDVAGLHRAVRSSGAEIVEPLREDKGRARFACLDPEGNMIEVVAPHPQH